MDTFSVGLSVDYSILTDGNGKPVETPESLSRFVSVSVFRENGGKVAETDSENASITVSISGPVTALSTDQWTGKDRNG